MPSSYSVTITLPAATASDLQRQGFRLYGLSSVGSAIGGVPLVWFSSTQLATTIPLTWPAFYGAFASSTPPGTGKVIHPISTVEGALGSEVSVDQAGTVMLTGGMPDHPQSVRINNGPHPYTCGLTLQGPGGVSAPFCAFDLAFNVSDLITPLEKVFLMFSQQDLELGTVLEQSPASGALIDLSGAAGGPVAATFDLTSTPPWRPTPQVTPQPFNTDLVQLLIKSGPTAPGSDG